MKMDMAHTASTTAGLFVKNASFLGYGLDTSIGMAPKVRLAMNEIDMAGEKMVVRAMNATVKDGVHILSLSLGFGEQSNYLYSMAIGAFSITRAGVFVVCAAGNFYSFESVENTASWITTISIGILDRCFPTDIVLGDGNSYTGESLYDWMTKETNPFILIRITNCTKTTKLEPSLVAGKAVVCSSPSMSFGFELQAFGVAALIRISEVQEKETIAVRSFPVPFLFWGHTDGDKLVTYINSSFNPTVNLIFLVGTVIASNRAPIDASFSSRDPSIIVLVVLKPDLITPSVDILAAWRTDIPSSKNSDDPRRTPVNIISGTLMPTPHVAWVAALIRKAHLSSCKDLHLF